MKLCIENHGLMPVQSYGTSVQKTTSVMMWGFIRADSCLLMQPAESCTDSGAIKTTETDPTHNLHAVAAYLWCERVQVLNSALTDT